MNVLLYVADAIRADHLSCYGYDRETSPTIDELAADGVRFQHCFSPATWTRPVAASLLTGLYPPAHGTRTREDKLAPSHDTLAEQFRNAGYETVGITSMGNVSSPMGFDRGFDRFFDLYRDEEIIAKRNTSSAADEELYEEEGTIALPRAADIAATFDDWLSGHDGEEPFFAFCWGIDPHEPYDPPPEYDRFGDPDYDGPVDGSRESLKQVETDADLARLEALYDGEIKYTDACLDTLVESLRSAGVFDETLVCLVGDHGEAFHEHGRLTHGHAPYDELVHVPWVVRPPGEASSVSPEALVSLVDVYPTLLDAAGILVPERPDVVSGQSVAPLFEGDAVAGHESVFSETNSYDMQNTFYSVRTSKWKYIRIDSPDRIPGTFLDLFRYVLRNGLLTDILRHPRYYWQRYRYDERTLLFDLEVDPDERGNLIDEEPEQGSQLDERLNTWLRTCEQYRETTIDENENPTDALEIDGQTREQLRELGYTE